MFNARTALAALLLFAVFLSGCFSSLKVLRQATTSPFASTSSYALMAPTFKDLHVNEIPEAEYLKTREKESLPGWEGDKAKVVEAFSKMLMKAEEINVQPSKLSKGADFRIYVNIDKIEPGFFAYVTAEEGRVRMRVKIIHDGKVVDEVEIEAENQSSMYEPTIRDRLEHCGALAGEELVEYLEGRQK